MQEKELRINVKSVWYPWLAGLFKRRFCCFMLFMAWGSALLSQADSMVGTFCFHRVFLTYERYVNSCRECLQLPLSDERI